MSGRSTGRSTGRGTGSQDGLGQQALRVRVAGVGELPERAPDFRAVQTFHRGLRDDRCRGGDRSAARGRGRGPAEIDSARGEEGPGFLPGRGHQRAAGDGSDAAGLAARDPGHIHRGRRCGDTDLAGLRPEHGIGRERQEGDQRDAARALPLIM